MIQLPTPTDEPTTPCALQVLGDFIGSMPELRRILNGLKEEGFKEGDYDVVRNNCNHFCDEFAFALVGKRIPPWVNRAATIGTWAGFGEVRVSVALRCVCERPPRARGFDALVAEKNKLGGMRVICCTA